MKKLINSMLLAFVMLMVMPFSLRAQGMDTPLPLDQEVRYGVLPNGLTYYIRHNEYPKGQADFYIAQKVGSILEEDNQRGLAHFLEHMCFNGTENFPGNSLISWLETKGVKFGQNLNAYTSVDRTVYNIANVPVADVAVQDSCLLILHDWADGLLLDPEEIDKERGVIHQEWRRSNVGQMRILEQLLPTMYPGSKYGYRLPIGTMEVVDNFPPQALRDYYEAWYRPDQQGIIVVGDIDVDRIENKIVEIFSPIEMPANAPVREYFPVPDHEGTIYAIGRDPEMQNNIIQMSFISDAMPDQYKNTMIYYVDQYIKNAIETMIGQRLSDLGRDPKAPFVGAAVNFDNYLLAKTKDALTVTAVSKTGNVEEAFAPVYREFLRAIKGGFTEGEYNRFRDEYLATLEKVYNNRNNVENGNYVNEYIEHFTDNVAAPGIEVDYQLGKMLSQMIGVNEINQSLGELVTNDNRVVLVMQTEKEGGVYPTPESLAALISAIDAEEVEAYVDNVKTEPLIPALPAPGKIVSIEENKQFDATDITLSNGVKVIVKKTPYKEDEIIFQAVANGGTSVVPDEYVSSLIFLPLAQSAMGLGEYTSSDLEKYLMGKKASVGLQFSDYGREIGGSTTPKDLPVLMELIYATFTEPTFDPTEFDAIQSMMAGYLANAATNPQFVFNTKLREALYPGAAREQMLSQEVVLGADREQVAEITKAMLANAADYTFIFVGNVDIETLKPLLEQYIATLPADAAKVVKEPTFIDATLIKGGKGIDTYTMEMATPQTTVEIRAFANLPYTAKNAVLASIAGQVLSNRLLESVREREGAVYSIGARGWMSRLSQQNAQIRTQFPMDPDKKDLVLGIIEAEVANMAENILPEELQKAQEFMVKQRIEEMEVNSELADMIGAIQHNGVDTYNGYVELVNSLTPADVADFMKQLNAAGNYRVVILDPEAAK